MANDKKRKGKETEDGKPAPKKAHTAKAKASGYDALVELITYARTFCVNKPAPNNDHVPAQTSTVNSTSLSLLITQPAAQPGTIDNLEQDDWSSLLTQLDQADIQPIASTSSFPSTLAFPDVNLLGWDFGGMSAGGQMMGMGDFTDWDFLSSGT
ncbi:uncharacterized protein STEHIDRAFT_114490 [Stereum hirsutum FP-91666 SS1]|uniref:uncharacterized protein n=1 Tax=Stereum hirsutum (strain FP-91666) TaxID=721885 RepID=UPI00044497A4|nr:uncharacterized protein STEHIDRAFT_114490 [Stereum hirsutum FP-91666 SS1]EIM82609.1 hypothetical protein STEHIDRAFT_114490 [Stereum hirsutum FP-91666 SS1]